MAKLAKLMLPLLALPLLASPSSAVGATAMCPNEAFRTGSSSTLPNCRAYELITPPDTNGRLVGALNTFDLPGQEGGFPGELVSPSGSSMVYMSYISPLLELPGANGATDVYEARRLDTGWTTVRRLSPPGDEAEEAIPGGITSDHLYGTTNVGGTLSTMALDGQTEYLINPDGTYELVGIGSLGTEPFAQARWVTDGGAHVIFSTGQEQTQSFWCFHAASCKVQQLEPEAPPSGTGAVYDRSADGSTHVISLLPGNVSALEGEEAFYKGTSKDASSIAFTINGVLYVVRNGNVAAEETLKVAEGNPEFASLSDEGRYLFYLAAGNIYRYDTETADLKGVTTAGDVKIVSISADGSHTYFISKSQIGGKGAEGQPNMFVWSEGATKYIATLLSSEVEAVPGVAAWSAVVRVLGPHGLGASLARTTPDGKVLVFASKAQLTPYDNAGHTEIYRYEPSTGLICISCNPGVQPAVGDAQLQDLLATRPETLIHNLSDDGRRVFFETPESLVAEDLNTVNDIYEWSQREGGAGDIDLISSGNSSDYAAGGFVAFPFQPKPNVLLSVTPNGNDVAFLSPDTLVPGAGEGGVPAIYDARVNGGFPVPAEPKPCAEEDCRPGANPDPTQPLKALSEVTKGTGNVKPRKHHRCRRKRKSDSKRQRVNRRCSRHRGSKHATAHTSSNASGAEEAPPPASTTSTGPGPGSDLGSPTSISAVGTSVQSFSGFGIETAAAQLGATGAGLHPDFTTEFSLNHRIGKGGNFEGNGNLEEISVALPPGLLGNPRVIPQCSTGAFVSGLNCPADSQIGVTTFQTLQIEGKEPVYNLAPPHPESEVARFGFYAFSFPVFLDLKVRTASDYGVTATVHGAASTDQLISAKTTIWGNPPSPGHDEERFTLREAFEQCPGTACKVGGKRPSNLPPTAFLTNPSACQEQSVSFAVKSYQLPNQVFMATAPLSPITNCAGLPFSPSFEAQTTNTTAGAPTGLRTVLKLPQTDDPEFIGTATLREARVTLPAGVQVAAGAANWIGTCSEEEAGFHQEIDTACPDSSKLGTATITSPALSRPLQGNIYQRTPAPGHPFRLWLISDDLGLHVKLPGELEPDERSGRLTAVFRDLPQVPVQEIELNVWGGERAPLQTPDHCGIYTTDFSFAPHSNDPAVSGQSQMTIDAGCDQGFSPTLHAGVTNPVAGHFSPFVFDLLRDDGQQALRGFDLHLPEGLLAKLAGVPLCSDEAAAAGNCPPDSRIGSLAVASGPGSDPLRLPQAGKPEPQIYLAGPYRSAPFSIVSEVPAQAGPFDLGVVVVRSGLDVDPETAQVTVTADPLPQFFEGVGIAYRRLHAVIDRPNFSLNPTDCREMVVKAEATSTQGTIAHPAVRFQVDGCKGLKFKPRLSLKLKGGTRRGDYPALIATLRARKGDANIGRTSVGLPHSEFLAQEHIRTICTRKQFAADKCPKGSIYGKAKAFTPLLDKPLEGPVYLRSSDHPLPDLVVVLDGQLEINLVGRIDSHHGGIRTTFEQVPDAPVTKFVLKMKGGTKGLLVNSTGICRRGHRAAAAMQAQNGWVRSLRPLLRSGGCDKPRK